jgi:DNA-binding HxlR family transcriptional regulator
MTALSRVDVIRLSILHSWYGPFLQVLADGPARYSEIRARLAQLKGESPGDGFISKELRELQVLGLVHRLEQAGATRPVWALTDQGRWSVQVITDFEGSGATDVSAAEVIPHERVIPSIGSSRLEGDAGERRERRVGHGGSSKPIDTTTAHPARRYNYWLGGKDNFEADRTSADELERLFPTIRVMARQNRRFLQRAVRYLADEAGIRQFLDIGTGLPTADNTHEVAQRVAPESRILYVDNDPLVLAHARALLNSRPEGDTAYLEADLRRPAEILGDPLLARTLDLNRPVALVLVAVLHFIHGHAAAQPLVDQLMNGLPSGSYLVATHATSDFAPPEQRASYQALLDSGRSDVWPRERAEFTALFSTLELVAPGVVPVSEWRPELGVPMPDPADIGLWAAVGRKP